MKKLLLSGIAAVALMTAGSAQAADLDLYGGTGVARTPLAMSLAPMQMAVAADYVFSDDMFIPMRAAIGLPYGIEIGGAYWYTNLDADSDFKSVNVDLPMWDLTAKWVLPKFVENLSLAVGGHYTAQKLTIDDANFEFKNDGENLYGVATYVVPVGEGMALIPSAGIWWETRTGDNDNDAFKFFGSLLFKMKNFAVGGEYMSADDKVDQLFADSKGNVDGFWWVGGRYYLNEMITLQAGYLNNANLLDLKLSGESKIKDPVFHAGVQFAFGGGK
jgi:predicted porin